MRKRQLERVLAAAGRLASENEFFLIGSQALHAFTDNPPAEVVLSVECDIYPKNRPEVVMLLDRALGEKSSFSKRHGYYADVVTPELATLPDGWETRLKPMRVGKVTALCLEVHDLLFSKLAAGRLKDLELVGAVLKLKLAQVRVLKRRIQSWLSEADRICLQTRLEAVLREIG